MNLIAKSLMSLAFVITTSTLAFAASSEPVARMRFGGGMPAPGGLAGRELTLFNDGTVEVVERFHPSLKDWSDRNAKTPVKKYVLAKINSPGKIEQMHKTIAEIKVAKLQPIDPDQPQCQDAPGSTYSVFKGGKFVDVAATYNCVDQVLPDQSQRWMAENLRDDLRALDRYAR